MTNPDSLTEQPAILIVDDTPEIVAYMHAILAGTHARIISAFSGPDALTKIKNENLALAIIDIMMPGMNGPQLAGAIFKNSNHFRIPVIFMTSFEKEEMLEECYEAGGVDYITKPIRKEILLGKVNVFLDLYNQRYELFKVQQNLQKTADKLDEAYAALSKSEQRFRNLIEQSLLGQLIIQDEKIIFSNDAFERMSGLDSAQIERINKNGLAVWEKLMNLTVDRNNYKKVLSGEQKSVFNEYQLTMAPGEPAWYQVYANYAEIENRPALHIMINNITEWKKNATELQNFINLSNDLVCLISINNLSLIKLNPAFNRILGYNENELTGKPVMDIVQCEDRTRTITAINESIPTKQKFNFDIRCICYDESYRWISWALHPMPEMGLIYAVGHDITQRKNFELKISESERMLRSLFNTLPEGIFILDASFRITEVSDIAMELFDYNSTDAFSGQPFLKIINTNETDKINKILARTLEEGLVLDEEFVLMNSKNIPFFAEISTALIQDNNGIPIAFMAIIRDISARKSMEQNIIQTERLAGIGEMAASLAHELNQPLVGISFSLENIMSEIIKKNLLNKDYLKKKSDNIFENLGKIENIIDHVRAFSRGIDDSFQGLFDVNSSIRNSIMLISEQLINKEIKLSTDLAANLPDCKGNTYKFEQVIINLLINAKDAILEMPGTRPAGIEKSISVRTSIRGKNVTTEIEDTGCGIDNENLDKILIPFFSTKKAGKGTGLGLTISHRIISEMGGDLLIKSQVGSGTKITIVMPGYYQ